MKKLSSLVFVLLLWIPTFAHSVESTDERAIVSSVNITEGQFRNAVHGLKEQSQNSHIKTIPFVTKAKSSQPPNIIKTGSDSEKISPLTKERFLRILSEMNITYHPYNKDGIDMVFVIVDKDKVQSAYGVAFAFSNDHIKVRGVFHSFKVSSSRTMEAIKFCNTYNCENFLGGAFFHENQFMIQYGILMTLPVSDEFVKLGYIAIPCLMAKTFFAEVEKNF